MPPLIKCQHCGNKVKEENTVETWDDNLICTDCAEEHFRYCIRCDALYDPDECGHSNRLCPDCGENYFICVGCGEIVDNGCYGEDGYCDDCWGNSDEEGEVIWPYHCSYRPKLTFYPSKGSNEDLFFGVELETELYPHPNQAAEDVLQYSKDRQLFFIESDSSLSSGFELITQPATLDFHRTQFPWDDICETLTEHKGRSEDSPAAAMHVHCAKTFFKSRPSGRTLKLIYLVEKYRKECLKTAICSEYLADRSATKYLQGYSLGEHDCNWLLTTEDDHQAHRDKLQSLESDCERLRAINTLTDTRTIEFRLFRSTLNKDRIIANLEFTDLLIRLARDLPMYKVKQLSWKQIVSLAGSNGYSFLPSMICPKKKPSLRARIREGEVVEGNSVRIRSNVEPRHGRGYVQGGEVGTVKHIERRNSYKPLVRVIVNFPSCNAWTGYSDELEVVEQPWIEGTIDRCEPDAPIMLPSELWTVE